MDKGNEAVNTNKNSRTKYLESIRDKLQKTTDETYELITGGDTQGKLPEHLFINNFLPYFSGELEITEENTVLATWISIAGNPTGRVSILGKNNEVLYSVPPLFDTGILNTLDKNSRSLSEIYHNYMVRKDSMPMSADNFLDNAMSEKYKTILSSVVNEKYSKEWQAIFNRYKVDTKTTVKEIDDLDEDFFDFS